MRNITSRIDCAFNTLMSCAALALLAAGCGAAAPAAEQASLADTWPTPETSRTTPSPTPFPRIKLSSATTPSETRIISTATPLPLTTLEATPVSPLASPTPVSPLENVDQARPVDWAEVISAGLNVRNGPGIEYPVIGYLNQGESVPVLEIDPDSGWLRVQVADDAGTGWISGVPEYVSLEERPPVPPRAMPAAETKEAPAAPGPAVYQMLPQVSSLARPAVEVVVAEVPVLKGPGGPAVGGLKQGDVVTVCRFDPASSSVLVALPGGGTGWVAYDGQSIRLASGISPQSLARPSTDRPAPAQGLTGPLVIQSSSGGEIYVVNADGSDLRRLTGGIDPALSPDGQTVAFTRWSGDDGSLWLIGIDGTNERQVAGQAKQAKHPAWSPDGRRIVVNFQHGGRLEDHRVCENYLTKLGGETPDNVPWNVDPDSFHLDIKDGVPYLCWVLPPDPHWGLRVVNLADRSFEDVPSDTYAYGPEWDPANPWRIVSSGMNGLVQLDVMRKEQWALTDQRGDHTPVISPDGHTIAVAYNSGGHWEIHRLNADGSGRASLTKVPLSVLADGKGPWNSTAPAWSPDGSKIAFLTDRRGRWELWVMNADGSDQRPLFPESVQTRLNLQYNGVDERMISWAE
jgi:TolB protein